MHLYRHENKENYGLIDFFTKNIWWVQRNIVPLQPLTRDKHK